MVKKYTNLGVFAVASVGLASFSWFPPQARGQEPAASNPAPTVNATSNTTYQPNQTVGSVPDYIRPQAHQPQRRRSIIHHYPYPYPGAYYTDETAGFRNPGGVGRYAEYYPPGDRFQVEGDPVRVARFGQEATPARRSKGPPSRPASLATIRSSGTSTTTRCPAMATVSAWAASAASGEPPSCSVAREQNSGCR